MKTKNGQYTTRIDIVVIYITQPWQISTDTIWLFCNDLQFHCRASLYHIIWSRISLCIFVMHLPTWLKHVMIHTVICDSAPKPFCAPAELIFFFVIQRPSLSLLRRSWIFWGKKGCRPPPPCISHYKLLQSSSRGCATWARTQFG